MAYDRVRTVRKPEHIRTKERFVLGALFGMVGVVNSMVLFFILTKFIHMPFDIIQTVFFLKLSVSGHLLIFVAHTKVGEGDEITGLDESQHGEKAYSL